MANRTFYIKDFRNLGTGEKSAKFILNDSLDKANLGNLLIVIGPNNSGKSNLIDALSCASISEEDKPDYLFDRNASPSVTLSIVDGEDVYETTKEINKVSFKHVRPQKEESLSVAESKAALKTLLDCFNQHWPGDRAIAPYVTRAMALLSTAVPEKEFLEGTEKIFVELTRDFGWNSQARAIFNERVLKRLPKNLQLKIGVNESEEEIKKEFASKYGIKLNPTIYRYQENQLRNSNLSTNRSSWKNNPLFVSLFSSLGVSEELINKTYALYRQNNNISTLTKFQRGVQKKLQKTADLFNKLNVFKANEGDKYSFEIVFNEESIKLGILLGDMPLNLEKQSTGFRAFFNLFFNFLNKTPFEPGDIIIMDEPGTRLAPNGIEELRDFLKKFASEHNITIILVTHLPFFVDPNHFDELRIVSREGEQAKICNDFHVFNGDYPDTLSPIVTALCTRNSVVLDPSVRKIYVEGMIDYLLLTAFIERFDVRGIVLLPINGVGAKGQQKKTLKEILAFDRDPTILVDGDQAGEEFAECAKNTCTVIKLSDIDPEWKEIEVLFKPNEIKENGLISGKKKDARMAAALKARIIAGTDNLSKETTENFRKLLKHLQDKE